jgi:hypothetical protein
VQARAGSAPIPLNDPALLAQDVDRASRDRALAEWASLLGPIVREMRSFGPASGTIESEPTGSNQSPVGAELTSAHLTGAPGSQTSDTPVNDPGPTRWVLSVTSETLGQIELVIDRERGGVSILIGASSEAQKLISADKFALLQTLSQGGVPVQSLGVVAREKVGTVLAQGKMASRQDDTRSEVTDPQAKGKKRLNLIG